MIYEKMEIAGTEILPGETKVIKIKMGRLTTGSEAFIRTHIYRSQKPGPVVLVQGGIHGDEINGVEIVRRLIFSGLFENLIAGTVIAIPLVNTYGFLQFIREVPDGKDINRSFPGFKGGSLASRIAYTLVENIVPHIDLAMDFHTGGASRYNYPQIRYTSGHSASRSLAIDFAPPFIISKKALPDSFRNILVEKDIPNVIFEGGEALRLNVYPIETAVNGVRRVLYKQGMLANAPTVNHGVLDIQKSSWIRAAKGGMFEWTKSSGQEVKKEEPIGRIKDPYGKYNSAVKSNEDGYIIGHNNSPLIYGGDALFNIGYDISKINIV